MNGKTFVGKVTSTKMQKTVVVSVEITKRHPIYKKTLRNTRKFKARDEMGVKMGDTVKIIETSPFSKDVTWKVTELVESAKK
ncbi:30S ribosomal protein S17 [candidate division WWE3 bacterium]|nr:30S ribosomal protein S17 [candidate division WWE3 bacterium]